MGNHKILYIHSGGDIIGGIERYLMWGLKHHKYYEPYIGIVKRGRFYEYLVKSGYKNVVDLKGGRLREIHKTVRAIFNIVRFIKKEKIEIVISNSLHSWIFAGFGAKICNIKSVLYFRDALNKDSLTDLVTRIGLIITPSLYMANSRFTAESVKNTFRRKIKIEINYPAAQLETFDSIDEKEAREFIGKEFGLDPFYKIYSVIGRIQIGKAQDTAILAFKNMKNKAKASLLIVGDCSYSRDIPYYNYLKKLSKDEKNIIFTGFRNDIPVLMKGSDVVIQPSRFPEGFGIVIIEGMMAKIPVIASSHGGPMEIIDNGIKGILFKPGDWKELSKLMDRLFEDENLRQRIGLEGYRKAKDMFTIQKSFENFEKIIRSL
ncbi:MAG: hypothetical protein DRO92_04210 [Candidatus Altiarchaeales archaeon]|nr:MAG: hypothetical protein DRO92_04210 [Candidatus Altiarchaeales archaeon]